MNRTRLNLLLVVIVLALGAAAWVAKQQKDKPKATLTPLAAEGVNKILIEWPGSPTIQLERQGGDWLLQAPVKTRADRFEAVGASSLASTEVQSTLDGEGIDLKELGLAPPDHTVTLNDIKIEFGATEPLQSRRYVRVDGVVKLIDDPNSASLDKDYADLVSKALFASGDELVKIELPGLTLSRGAGEEWTVPAGTANATPQALKSLAQNWKTVQAMWIEPAPGDPPAGDTVRITSKDGRVTEFVVAGVDPQFALYSAALKVRYQLSKALADDLLKLRAPAPLPAAAAAATKP